MAFVIALVGCWVSAGVLPLVDTLHDLRAPNDFTPDYVTAVAWVRLGKCGQPLPSVLGRATADDYAQSIGARRLENLPAPTTCTRRRAARRCCRWCRFAIQWPAAIWQLTSVALIGIWPGCWDRSPPRPA